MLSSIFKELSNDIHIRHTSDFCHRVRVLGSWGVKPPVSPQTISCYPVNRKRHRRCRKAGSIVSGSPARGDIFDKGAGDGALVHVFIDGVVECHRIERFLMRFDPTDSEGCSWDSSAGVPDFSKHV